MTINDYMNLFPAFSREKPCFSALAEAVLRQVTDLMALVPQLASGFSFSSAEGAQLDVAEAEYLGRFERNFFRLSGRGGDILRQRRRDGDSADTCAIAGGRSAAGADGSEDNLISGKDLGEAGFRYLGVPYSKMDCQAFVEQCLWDCGLEMNLAGSNADTMTAWETPPISGS